MANVPTIKGKENLFKHFKATKACYWKVYNANDTKAPLRVCNSTMKIDESLGALTDFVDILDPDGIYILDTFIPTETKDKSMIRPDTSICFSLQDHFQNKPVKQSSNSDHESKVGGYTPEFGEHIKLIQDNAKLKSEYDFATLKLNEALQDVSRLENENKVLQDFIDSEEEEEEEEENQIGTINAKDQLFSALAGLIKDKGSVMIEHVLGMPKKQPVDATPINGTTSENENLILICDSLKKHDPKIQEHLVKLLAIAENMPDTFKMIIAQLDQM